MIESEDLREKQRALKDLLGSPGWEVISAIVAEQVKMRETLILVDEDLSWEGVLSQVKAKGERLGMRLTLELPKTLVEQLEEEIEEALDEEERGNG